MNRSWSRLIIGMTGHTTNLFELNKEHCGRCDICTGCGRCKEIHRDVKVLVNFLHEGGLLHAHEEKTASGNAGNRKDIALGIDLGTTTIAMVCYNDKDGTEEHFTAVNPQIRYGRDVLSRIEASEDGQTAKELRRLVTEVLEEGVRKLLDRFEAGESEVSMVLSGNTTMLYLLKGLPAETLGRAPFTVEHKDVGDISLAGYPCTCVPVISAFVGGDVLTGLWTNRVMEKPGTVLYLDLGTNGEIGLKTPAGLFVTATAAGPAFEGGPCNGVWGADMVHLLAGLLQSRIVDATGLLSAPYFEKGILTEGICITQEVVRAFQTAKGAIRAGIEVLLRKAGINAGDITEVLLAGGFGYFLNPSEAVRTGLLPKILADRAKAVGNASLQGALEAAQTWSNADDIRSEWKKLCDEAQVVNLAMDEEFQELFIGNLNFPE